MQGDSIDLVSYSKKENQYEDMTYSLSFAASLHDSEMFEDEVAADDWNLLSTELHSQDRSSRGSSIVSIRGSQASGTGYPQHDIADRQDMLLPFRSGAAKSGKFTATELRSASIGRLAMPCNSRISQKGASRGLIIGGAISLLRHVHKEDEPNDPSNRNSKLGCADASGYDDSEEPLEEQASPDVDFDKEDGSLYYLDSRNEFFSAPVASVVASSHYEGTSSSSTSVRKLISEDPKPVYEHAISPADALAKALSKASMSKRPDNCRSPPVNMARHIKPPPAKERVEQNAIVNVAETCRADCSASRKQFYSAPAGVLESADTAIPHPTMPTIPKTNRPRPSPANTRPAPENFLWSVATDVSVRH